MSTKRAGTQYTPNTNAPRGNPSPSPRPDETKTTHVQPPGVGVQSKPAPKGAPRG